MTERQNAALMDLIHRTLETRFGGERIAMLIHLLNILLGGRPRWSLFVNCHVLSDGWPPEN